MHDDIILNKTAIIDRCIHRIKEEYVDDESNLYENFTRQDSIILNLQRICEASIDMAMHVASVKRLGLPQDSREGFDLLQKVEIISEDLCDELKKMVGFRNIAVHDYQELNLDIIKDIIENRLDIFYEFLKAVNRL
ncbi:MAG: DUF86 domain-containing protein [Nitrospirota bacterium]